MLLAVACSSNPTASPTQGEPLPPTAEAILVPSDAATPQSEMTMPATSAPDTPTVAPTVDTLADTQPDPQTNASDLAAEVVCTIDPHIDFFGYPEFDILIEDMGCALTEPSFGPVALNEFGEGPKFDRFMLWTSIDQMIYVLRPDGLWESHLDTWSEDLPELACNPFGSEFSSPPLPRRGFGKVWCESGGVAETMGIIMKEERLCQHAVLQQFESGQLLACFEDSTYRYFRIMDDQTWESIFIQ